MKIWCVNVAYVKVTVQNVKIDFNYLKKLYFL